MKPIEIEREMERGAWQVPRTRRACIRPDLRRPSTGTRWTNRQLLWHMVFGYLIARTLLPLVRVACRLGWSGRFAAVLNAAHRPFHLIKLSRPMRAGQIVTSAAMARLLDPTINILERCSSTTRSVIREIVSVDTCAS